MFEILLIVAQWWLENQSSRATTRPSYTLAAVARPEWNQATPSRVDEVPNELPWPAPEKSSPFVDGVPPSPAILNAQGWKNAAGAFGSLISSWLCPHGMPIDSSEDPKDLSPVTAEVAILIDRLEKGATDVPRRLTFRRAAYDLTRGVETRATGYLTYRSAACGEFQFAGILEDSGASAKKNSEGNPFTIEAGPSEMWIWTDQEILHINRTDKTYSVAPLAKNINSESQQLFRQSIHDFAPFVTDLRALILRREWSLTLIKQDVSHVILEAIPRTAEYKYRFNKCLILMNAKSAQVSAIKYIDAAKVHETVYVLDECRELKPRPFESRMQAGHGSLKGFRNIPMPAQ